MNISGIINDLQAATTKLSNISSDVANMVIIDGSINSTRDMNDKLHEIRNELSSISRIIEENKATIQSCCDALGISVSFYSCGGGGSSSPRMEGPSRNTVMYERY